MERAGYFKGLVEGGFAEDPVEAAFRFAFSKKEVATALIGASSLEQLEHGIACAEKGPLPETALETLAAVWAEF